MGDRTSTLSLPVLGAADAAFGALDGVLYARPQGHEPLWSMLFCPSQGP
jgi:hypothetical protein